ncbi:MAG: hypothetical protein K0R18_2691 [Bacillales bacterium]|jgi:uncharacterized membrane protein|nr:hypothetical protein [Bacillales bacterium]
MFREAYHPAMNGHHVMFGHFIGLLILLLIVSFIFHAVVRSHRRRLGNQGFHSFHGHNGYQSCTQHRGQDSSQVLELLNTRYVNGEITEEEYLKIKTNITQ